MPAGAGEEDFTANANVNEMQSLNDCPEEESFLDDKDTSSQVLLTSDSLERTDVSDNIACENGRNSHKAAKDEEEPVVEIEFEGITPLHYRISDVPPPHLLVLFGFQQALLSISSPLSVSIVVAEVVCAQNDDLIKAQVLSASMFMCGVATFLMNTFGVRLPIFQGPTAAYLIPLLAMTSTPEFQCPETYEGTNPADNTSVLLAVVANGTTVPARELILTKISQLSGSLVLVGVIHFILGLTGLVGIIVRYIGPVTLVPTIVLVGLFIYKVVVKFSEPSWLVASVTCIINLTLSLFLSKRQTPIPLWTPSRGFHIYWFPFHQVFSVLLSLLAGWAFSAILTVCGAFTDDPTSKGYLARTDAKGNIVAEAPFFDVPYPGKFGGYSFSIAGFLSFLIATMLSVLDSIGDYGACARTAQAIRPPRFAFNRGIAVEGIVSLFSGFLGCCHATVSYGGNIGAIGITRVASRRVFQLCGIIYICSATCGKLGALFLSIPIPVLGGSSLIMMGLFTGMVLSYLE
ncbi:solute carrier family 23 member 2, partial [Plakobranchus ocellatus]